MIKIKLYIYIAFILLATTSIIYSCRKPQALEDSEWDERMSGGDCTVFDESAGAFGNVINGLSDEDKRVHGVGDGFFDKTFVPVSTTSPAVGLGPVFNQLSCVRCHINAGRGSPPLSGQPYQSMFFKLSVPGVDTHGAPLPVPGYGAQLQDKAIAGTNPEGTVVITYNYITEKLADGTDVQLRQPIYQFANLYTSMPANVLYSPRVSRSNFGMGLIEAISEESILRSADPNDINGDGISGKVNYVYDYITHQGNCIGRIGWKASVPNIKNQVAKALNEDIGVTTSIFPVEYETTQQGGKIELPDSIVNALTFYMKTLAVPARRNVKDEAVRTGKKLFIVSGCVKCHADKHETATDVSFKPLSGQIIRPYSDFLLHDMGPALADGRPEFDATGNEWRTPPLWGIGLNQRVNGNTNLLHDGRARNYTEAVMWHGGEAQSAKDNFKKLTKTERDALVKFLESL